MKLYEPFDFLTPEECQELINIGRAKNPTPAKINKGTRRFETGYGDDKERLCNISWYTDTKYKNKIQKVFQHFDKTVLVLEDLQLSFYKHNDFFNWHKDTLYKPYGEIKYVRKFSMSIELQSAPQAGLFLDSNVYPDIPRNEDLTIKIKPGQAFVFPSMDWHMAWNKGNEERISLVAWAGHKNITKH